MAVTIAATLVGHSIKVEVSGHDGTSPVVSRRNVYGTTGVRISAQVDVDGLMVGYDYEAPMDVASEYTVEGAISEKVTLPSEGKDWWVCITKPTLTRAVTVESFATVKRPLGHALVQAMRAKNPVPVLHRRRGLQGTLTLLSLTAEESQAVRRLIDDTPLLFFATPPEHGYGEGLYLLAGDYDEVRPFRTAQQPERRFVIDVQEIDRPPVVTEQAPTNSWQDWVDSGKTWGDWRDIDYVAVLTDTGMTA